MLNNPSPPTALVFDFQHFALHDGPGIRTTVFLKGCPLCCQWCHNPESRSPQPTLMWMVERCIHCGQCASVCPHGAHTMTEERHGWTRERCVTCGACVEVCFPGALELAGRSMSVDEVFSVVLRDAPFHRRSGGGLTVSGGEPLMHYPFVRALFEATHAQGIHNALDTSGLCPWEPLAALAPFVDLFLYDVKHLDPDRHIALTGVSNERILDNLHRLNGAGKTLWVRVPLIPGQNDDLANYHAMGRLFATLKRIERVELLRYHRLAEAKYARMGLEYPLAGLATPSEADAESRRRLLESYGLPRVTWR